ncbi:MAG: TetR/AcrR family transcriptional regulator [Vicinamibacterales bacterium]
MPAPLRGARRTPSYHHGDLPRALVAEAVRIIRTKGVDALTLRAVGARLGVSRSALYRHFADKQALLAAVAAEGFRGLTDALQSAWIGTGGGLAGFNAMGLAYVRFAQAHAAHYRVMFGTVERVDVSNPERDAHAKAAFGALVDAIVALQAQRWIEAGDPMPLAQYIWATVHGIAMLAIDGQLKRQGSDGDRLVRFFQERLLEGIGRGETPRDHRGAAADGPTSN